MRVPTRITSVFGLDVGGSPRFYVGVPILRAIKEPIPHLQDTWRVGSCSTEIRNRIRSVSSSATLLGAGAWYDAQTIGVRLSVRNAIRP